jgi:hypothetical protein
MAAFCQGLFLLSLPIGRLIVSNQPEHSSFGPELLFILSASALAWE